MAESIQFELVSPEAKLVSEPVSMAVVPGVEGEMGVMAGHSSFVVALKPGVVQLHMEEGRQAARKIFIAGGFADITADNCTVLAEAAVNVADLDRTVVEQEISDLKEDSGLAKEDADKARIEAKLVIAKARLQAVTGQLVI